jgi:hypothetical protein
MANCLSTGLKAMGPSVLDWNLQNYVTINLFISLLFQVFVIVIENWDI